MKLHVLPISSYAQKTLMAFYEMGVAFERILVNVLDPAESAAFRRLTPLGKNPLLELADGRRIVESSIIIEYVDRYENKGRQLIPDDPEAALEVRLRDRFADLYFNTPMSKLAQDPRLPEGENDPRGVRLAKATLDTMFAMTDGDLAHRAWIAGRRSRWPTARWRPRSPTSARSVRSMRTRTSPPTRPGCSRAPRTRASPPRPPRS